MAPVKFGLFKARSREQAEQPSTENLLQSCHSADIARNTNTPTPSTSKVVVGDDSLDFSVLNFDDVSENGSRRSSISNDDMHYHQLNNPSITSTSTLDKHIYDEPTTHIDVSTSCDAHSSQLDVSHVDENSDIDINSEFDTASIATSEDLSVYCAMMKKPKKSRSKEQQLRDVYMWQASNVEVMQNLLNRSGTFDEQIKWEAIATARGLCTLTDSCTCKDCTGAKYLAGISDGDGGLGAAPLFNAINVGCQIQ